MRALLITAGAGGMYCGSCVRDNALATALLERGHDVSLLPIYTPTLTDEPNVSEDVVFFGGVSVYLQQNFPLFRHTPALLDRLWDSGPVLRYVASKAVSTDPRWLGELTVSTLRGEGGFQRKEIAKLTRWLMRKRRFDCVVLPNSMLSGLAAPLRRAAGCPVVCTLQGEDLFIDALGEPYRSEAKRWIAAHADSVDCYHAVSRYYADHMADYAGLPRAKIDTVPLGISLDGHRRRNADPASPFTIGYFARIAPEKGFAVLAEAYRTLRREHGITGLRLEAAGYMAADQGAYLDAARGVLEEAGLGGEFRYHGTLDRAAKLDFLRSLDVLSVPSPYVEPKALYVLEALANGVPVVQPNHGAFPEIVEATGGGLLFEPGDTAALAGRLAELARDRRRSAELGQAGAAGVRRAYGVSHMAEAFERSVATRFG